MKVKVLEIIEGDDGENFDGTFSMNVVGEDGETYSVHSGDSPEIAALIERSKEGIGSIIEVDDEALW